jgi:putative FmdB family regulatory protein
MPLYEYVCEEDDEVIELLRPMRDADAPVDDPSGRGRRFVRVQSTFGVGGKPASGASLPVRGGMCGCGKPHGTCRG